MQPDVREKIEKVLSFLIEQEGFHSDTFINLFFKTDVDFMDVIGSLCNEDIEYSAGIRAILNEIGDYYIKFKIPPSKPIILKESAYVGPERTKVVAEILDRITPPDESDRFASHFSALLADLVLLSSEDKIVSEIIPALRRTVGVRDTEKFVNSLKASQDLLGRITKRFYGIGTVIPSGAVPASFLVSDTLKREAPPGIPIGLSPYDRLFGGVKKSELVIFLARTGVGKTMFAIFVTACMISDGYRVFFLSKEMDWESIETRLLAHFTGIPILKIERRLYDDSEEREILEALDVIRNIGKNLIFSPGRGVETTKDIEEEILKSRKYLGDSMPDVLVIDYLNLLSPLASRKDADSHWLKQALVAQEIKDLAQKLDLPIIALAQANTEARRGALSDDAGAYLAYSKYIANPADVIILFWNDKDVPPMRPLVSTDFGTPGLVHAKIVKGRNIGTGWEFSFEVEWSILSIKETERGGPPSEVSFE